MEISISKISHTRLRLLALCLAICAVGTAPFFAAAAASESFYFVQISDTHHGKWQHHIRFTNAVEQINNLPFPLEVVAHTGDFASDNLHNEASAATISNTLAKINAPVICVPGNHDLSQKGNDPDKRLADSLANYRKYIGELGTVYETDNALYITVCTEGLTRDLSSATDFDPIAFLSDALAKNVSGKPAFVFTHIPDGEDFYNGALHPTRYARRDEWRKTLADGKVTAVIAGHFHRDELQQQDADGIPTYICPPIADFWGRQGSFRIYEYKNGRLSYRTVYIEDRADTSAIPALPR